MNYEELTYNAAPMSQTTSDALCALGIVVLFIMIVLILLSAPPADKNRPTLIESVLLWWDGLWTFPMTDYNNEVNNYRGARNMHYGNWNTPIYRNVWVHNFIPNKTGGYDEVYAEVDFFINKDDKHDWSWLASKGVYGWKSKKPPAKPSIIMSDGVEDDVKAILDKYNANKVTAKTYMKPEFAAKSSKLVEIDPKNEQKAENATK